MSTAHDHGQPRLRVRRLQDDKGWLRSHRRYEVEFTPVGADSAEWVRATESPQHLLEPYLGVADSNSVVKAADGAWDGGAGPWESLFPGDRGVDPGSVPDQPGR